MITFPHILVIISAGVSIAGASTYIRDTIRGNTKPNRVSWSMWALAPMIGTAAALAAHADVWATSRIFLSGFLPLIIVVASFVNPGSYWKLTLFDALCGVCSLVALFIWLGVQSPTGAILVAALGDGFACIPTLRKAWLHPETESGIVFLGSLVAVLLVVPSIPKWDIQNSAFQIYLLAANVALLFSIYRKRIFNHETI